MLYRLWATKQYDLILICRRLSIKFISQALDVRYAKVIRMVPHQYTQVAKYKLFSRRHVPRNKYLSK